MCPSLVYRRNIAAWATCLPSLDIAASATYLQLLKIEVSATCSSPVARTWPVATTTELAFPATVAISGHSYICTHNDIQCEALAEANNTSRARYKNTTESYKAMREQDGITTVVGSNAWV